MERSQHRGGLWRFHHPRSRLGYLLPSSHGTGVQCQLPRPRLYRIHIRYFEENTQVGSLLVECMCARVISNLLACVHTGPSGRIASLCVVVITTWNNKSTRTRNTCFRRGNLYTIMCTIPKRNLRSVTQTLNPNPDPDPHTYTHTGKTQEKTAERQVQERQWAPPSLRAVSVEYSQSWQSTMGCRCGNQDTFVLSGTDTWKGIGVWQYKCVRVGRHRVNLFFFSFQNMCNHMWPIHVCTHARLGRCDERAPSLGIDCKDVHIKFPSAHLDLSS